MRLCTELTCSRVGAVKSLDGTGVLAGVGVNGGLDARQPRRRGGCPLGMGEGSGEMVERGASHAFGVGQLGSVAEHSGGSLVVIGLSGTFGSDAVIGAT